MRKSLLLLSALAVACAGCGSGQPTSIAENKHDNEITDRQKLVYEFRTSEVYATPDNNLIFIVRDTNGAVWYAHSGRGNEYASGKTLIFPATVPAPVKLPLTEDDFKQRQAEVFAMALLRAYTNSHPVTNWGWLEDVPVK